MTLKGVCHFCLTKYIGHQTLLTFVCWAKSVSLNCIMCWFWFFGKVAGLFNWWVLIWFASVCVFTTFSTCFCIDNACKCSNVVRFLHTSRGNMISILAIWEMKIKMIGTLSYCMCILTYKVLQLTNMFQVGESVKAVSVWSTALHGLVPRTSCPTILFWFLCLMLKWITTVAVLSILQGKIPVAPGLWLAELCTLFGWIVVEYLLFL